MRFEKQIQNKKRTNYDIWKKIHFQSILKLQAFLATMNLEQNYLLVSTFNSSMQNFYPFQSWYESSVKLKEYNIPNTSAEQVRTLFFQTWISKNLNKTTSYISSYIFLVSFFQTGFVPVKIFRPLDSDEIILLTFLNKKTTGNNATAHTTQM